MTKSDLRKLRKQLRETHGPIYKDWYFHNGGVIKRECHEEAECKDWQKCGMKGYRRARYDPIVHVRDIKGTDKTLEEFFKLFPAIKQQLVGDLVEVGSYIQWEASGTLMFGTPMRVSQISDCGEFCFVEGSRCGIPIQEAILQRP